ncbi:MULTISPECIES: ATP synthase subunit C [Halanaerobium]|jgi:V/A-type H+-transporting ATPase subunit K|uniref:V/A-type H+-transporting ATPase subunit K n=1 Tax=Halanaerobium saccharolyticum TaxID=43595 RepID=A0A4R6S655_9FIRM|nr:MULTISPECIES: ATP synthase subunit C [Halanaerobium]PUU89992.1 MAG: V-type H+-transporting ATPase subunit K [Halanaerobium sp.]TDP95272.1 V/A-type H+-transporting ATPase subunit K [Halanaerobium saccharolyticum]
MILRLSLLSLFITVFIGGVIMFKKTEKRWVKYSVLSVSLVLLLTFVILGSNIALPQKVYAAEAAVNSTSNNLGLGYLAAGLAVGIASIGAGIAVGIAGSAAIGAISEKPEILGRALIIIGLGEGIAIYGLIISIMILGRL